MNKNIVIGHAKIMLGSCRKITARIAGNATAAEAGQRCYFAGKGQVAAGEAQQIIKRCINRLPAQ